MAWLVEDLTPNTQHTTHNIPTHNTQHTTHNFPTSQHTTHNTQQANFPRGMNNHTWVEKYITAQYWAFTTMTVLVPPLPPSVHSFRFVRSFVHPFVRPFVRTTIHYLRLRLALSLGSLVLIVTSTTVLQFTLSKLTVK